jgi:murein DD-endopeptidase MepM/ murein hydrolase activator NlpD
MKSEDKQPVFNIIRDFKKALTKSNGRRRFLQILIIPDDKNEPKSISLPVKRLFWFKVLAVFAATHILVGFYSYYHSYRLEIQNRQLTAINSTLRENNKRVLELSTAFEELEASQSKIRTALGLGHANPSGYNEDEMELSSELVQNVAPIIEPNYPQNQKNESSIQEKLGFLRRSKSTIHNFDRSIPSLLPVEGVLTNDYDAGLNNNKALHRGIDIAAARGTLVKSAADGIVVFSGWTPDLGNLLVIFHGNGFMTYYGHNQRLLVTRNTPVKKGDTIAYLGSSGMSSAPHLHFEVWKDGLPLDPKEFILTFSEKK